MTLILRPRGRLMGQVTTWITVGSIFAAGREMQCKALVDTGAYCLTLPAVWRDRFGTLPMSEIVEVEMADGRVEKSELCGPLKIRIADFSAFAGNALFIDMPLDDEGNYVPLIGYMTLEGARVAVDVVAHRLRRIPRVDLKRARRAA